MTLKKEIESILLKYAGNGHSTDVFYLEVKEAVTRPRPTTKRQTVYLDFEAGMWRGITQEYIGELQDCYPACDIMLQLKAMKGWCFAVGAKGHKSNWKAFIARWLSKEQDKVKR
jgi:hypothetical protein